MYRFLKTIVLMSLILFLGNGCAQAGDNPEKKLTGEQVKKNIESFELVWKTIRDKHFDPELGGLDWQAVHDRFRVQVEKAVTMSEARRAMNRMIGMLKHSHCHIIPDIVYNEMAERKHHEKSNHSGKKKLESGSSGIQIRIIDRKAVITAVEKNSSAAGQGILPGWIVQKVDGKALSKSIPLVEKQYAKKSWKTLMVTASAQALLKGSLGDKIVLDLVDGTGNVVSKTITLGLPKGKSFRFGHFQLGHIWCEKKIFEKDSRVGYIAFNGFFDVNTVMPVFNEAMQQYIDEKLNGVIIDLRGNPGGMPAMAMGMAGWFFDKKGLHLGYLMTRKNQLKFAILPRPDIFKGPVAVLVDGLSASTSEIFAAGFQDLKRARVFGSITAGAALPSVFMKLTNGDAFQYVVANFKSVSGKVLEGKGVEPDETVLINRKRLLDGEDPVIESAINWIESRTPER